MSTNIRSRGNKKDRIIEAAAQVFARSGYSNASVASIARQANIGKGTVYEYFQSKEDLFFAVFEWFQKKTEKAAVVGISDLGGGAADRLQALNDSLMGVWDEIKEVFALVMEFWAASSSTGMRQRLKGAFKQLYDDYRRIVSALVAAALVGTWDALFLQAWFDESFDPAATAKDFMDTLLHGLAA